MLIYLIVRMFDICIILWVDIINKNAWLAELKLVLRVFSFWLH